MAMNKNVIIGVAGFFLIIGGAVYLNKTNLGIGGATPTPIVSSGPSKYDNLAKCLTEKGAKMYGAFTCIHCKNQKETFGSAFQYVNYQECTVDGKAGTYAQVCKDAGIEGYPTWKFPDGAVKAGGVSFGELSEKTGCALPQ
ncbi:hypothetical protein KKB43_01570 [Patescibacteria group bacterium]|nr:hypothetical protein [Patescibacteria group bacterium]